MKKFTSIEQREDAPGVPVVVHVPHNSVVLPEEFKAGLRLDSSELVLELTRMTDHKTRDLFDCLWHEGATFVIAEWSRLILDPERFEKDEEEVMTKVGMGVIYTKTSQGNTLRSDPPLEEREVLLSTLYRPHHEAFRLAVEAQLERFGYCLIVDAHSFPSKPLPYELDQDEFRADICIGTTKGQTSSELVESIRAQCKALEWSFAVDKPFSGAIVPLSLFGNSCVESVMIEVNRGLYLNEATGVPSDEYSLTKEKLSSLCQRLLSHSRGRAKQL